MNQINKIFDDIKEFYKTTFGLSEEMVELVSDYDVVLLCCSGASNKYISEYLDIPLEDVEKILTRRIGFEGWVLDLHSNPYAIYLKVNGDEEKFKGSFDSMAYYKPIYDMCKKFEEMYIRINNEWI